jgi:formamidopyrimidine-DNA glycosylase
VPELPEVETIRQQLAKEVVGRKVKAVSVTNGRVVRRHASAKDFRALLEGRSLKSVGRLGKYLIVGLDNGSHLVIHLGMSGQIHKAKSVKEVKEKHTHVVITFTQGGELRFIDPRTFGEMFISTPPPEGTKVAIAPSAQVAMGGEGNATRAAVPELAGLGFDPVEDVMSWERFAVVLRHHKMGVKTFLTDQEIISGIGNIYADETLFGAGLRYDRVTDSLSTTEVRRLWRSMVEILAEAIKHGGSTLADEQFVDIWGKPGNFQTFHEVYAREGLPCRRCRRPIVKVKHQSRSTFLCEHCQI